jgi:hypothetical protein
MPTVTSPAEKVNAIPSNEILILGRKRSALLELSRTAILAALVNLRKSLADFPATPTQTAFLATRFFQVLDAMELSLERIGVLEDSGGDYDRP